MSLKKDRRIQFLVGKNKHNQLLGKITILSENLNFFYNRLTVLLFSGKIYSPISRAFLSHFYPDHWEPTLPPQASPGIQSSQGAFPAHGNDWSLPRFQERKKLLMPQTREASRLALAQTLQPGAQACLQLSSHRPSKPSRHWRTCPLLLGLYSAL